MFIQSPLIYSTHLTETFYRTFNDHVLNKGQGITAISVTKFLNYQLIPNAMIGDKVSYQLFLGNNSICVFMKCTLLSAIDKPLICMHYHFLSVSSFAKSLLQSLPLTNFLLQSGAELMTSFST